MHQLRTFADAFHARRGITFAKTFNEGREVPQTNEDGERTGKSWTQQWTIRHKEGCPAIIGVIYDQFDVGRGPECELVQVTVPANRLISAITDRMPLLLEGDDDIALWLGEWRAPITGLLPVSWTRR